MSSKGLRSTAPSNGADYLPIGLIDIELSTPPTELVDDTTIYLLGPDQQGSPSALLKVARGLLGTAELRSQRRVLSELALHHGLDGAWRELLPRVLAFDERTDATLSVESCRPGINLAEALDGQPDRLEELTAAALRAIAPLHRRTTTFVGTDNAIMLWRWLVGPLADLADMCSRLDPGRAVKVDRLSQTLRRDLRAWRVPVGWTHGGYTPGNVLVDGVQGRVTGIVDWGGGAPGRPALIDEYLLILTASCQVQGVDLGTVVTERLRAGGLLERERRALHAARDRTDSDAGDPALDAGGVDECVAVLLTWLHRVADLWRKRVTQPNHHVWWATNVAPVIDFAAARCPGNAGYFADRRVGE